MAGRYSYFSTALFCPIYMDALTLMAESVCCSSGA